MRLVKASLLKLAYRPATRITFIALLALLALVYVSIAVSANAVTVETGEGGLDTILTFPDAYGTLAALLVTFAGLGAAAYAGVIAGSEWGWGTFRSAVARGESRAAYVLGTCVAIAVVVLVGWLLLYAAGVLFVGIAGGVSGLPAGDPAEAAMLGRLPALVASGWWAVAMDAAIGFAAAFVTRSQVAGIVAVVALTFGEQFAAVAVPADLLRFAPMSAASGLVSQAAKSGLTSDALLGAAMTSLYLVLAVAAASVLARRAEVA